jgi:FtsZ-interacting cell division protein ZipA
LPPHDSAPRDWGVPPLEPLTIRTAEFEELPAMEPPMSSRAEPLADTMHGDQAAGEPAAAAPEPPAPPPRPPPSRPPARLQPQSPRLTPYALPPQPATPPPEAAPVGELRHIVSIRVSAPADAAWAGVDLLAALENHGLAHGRHSVFHRKHSDGRTQFYAASLVEPGTFSLASMPHEEFRGVTLYAVLPGPVEPLRTLDALIETAGALAQALDGSLLDSAGLPLTMRRAEALREDVARFQSQLAMIASHDPQ